jgi:hypothetical protein
VERNRRAEFVPWRRKDDEAENINIPELVKLTPFMVTICNPEGLGQTEVCRKNIDYLEALLQA